MKRARAMALRILRGGLLVGGVSWWSASCQNGANAASGSRSGARDRVTAVQVAAAQIKDLPIWLEGLGTVTASQQVTVHTEVDGRLDKVLFTEGQLVKQGDVLAQIDPRPFQIALAQAQGALVRDAAQLEMNQWNVARYKQLRAQNLVATQTVEGYVGAVGQFAGAVAVDRGQIAAAKLQLDYAQVKSPLEGITGIRQVDPGNIIHQTDANGLVVITAIDPIAVLFTVPQDRLTDVSAALARGDVPVEVYSRDGATKLATGKLAVLDNQVNQSTSTLRLKALLPNPGRVLWPNAFVKARMLVQTRAHSTVVPLVAIQNGPQGTYVLVVGTDQIARLRPVVVALTAGDEAVIDHGVQPGEQIVVEGQEQVRPGSAVAINAPSAS